MTAVTVLIDHWKGVNHITDWKWLGIAKSVALGKVVYYLCVPETARRKHARFSQRFLEFLEAKRWVRIVHSIFDGTCLFLSVSFGRTSCGRFCGGIMGAGQLVNVFFLLSAFK